MAKISYGLLDIEPVSCVACVVMRKRWSCWGAPKTLWRLQKKSIEISGKAYRLYKNSLYLIFSLHICNRIVTCMYRKDCRPRRVFVYKGFSKNVGLDEVDQTKRTILSEPFVSENKQRDFFCQKALISDEYVSLMWIFCPFRPFLPSKRFLFLAWHGSEAPRIEN